MKLQEVIDDNKNLKKIFAFVKNEFDKGKHLPFHNWNHTIYVAQDCINIAPKNCNLEVVLTAAAFHDIGVLYGSYQGHEKRSAEKAVKILTQWNFKKGFINKVEKCILATEHWNKKRKLKTIEEKVVKDADFLSLGKKISPFIHGAIYCEFREQIDFINFFKKTIKMMQENLPEPFLTKKAKKYTVQYIKNLEELKKVYKISKEEEVKLML